MAGFALPTMLNITLDKNNLEEDIWKFLPTIRPKWCKENVECKASTFNDECKGST